MIGLVLVQRTWLGIGDIGNKNVISENKTRGLMFVSRESRQDKIRSYLKVVTCFGIQENE